MVTEEHLKNLALVSLDDSMKEKMPEMLQGSELLHALAQRFFPHAESLGFIRDDRQAPRLVCFRRKTDSAVQIFGMQFAKFTRGGREGFRVLFTEAPLTGINYCGNHLAPEDVFPGNFSLLRGCLRSGRSEMWFRYEKPLWNRLRFRRQNYADEPVGRLIDLFPQIIDWWNNKTKSGHLLILPPVLPPFPTHAPVFGCPVKPSPLQKFFARRNIRLTCFLGLAAGIDAAFAIQARLSPQLFGRVMAGAILGFIASLVFIRVLLRVRICINGGPFRNGDLVQVLAGAHAGKIAAVYAEWPSRNQVRVDLGEREWKEVKDVFGYVELCRVKPTT